MAELIESAKLAFLFIVLPLGGLAAVAAIGDRFLDRRYQRNLDLVETPHDFDDWREPVAPFFRTRFESHTRRRLAVAVVCGADPDKEMEVAAVGRPTSMTRQGEPHVPQFK